MRRIKLETEHTEKRSLKGRKSFPQSKYCHEVNPLPPRCLRRPHLLCQPEMERDAVENFSIIIWWMYENGSELQA